MNETETTLFGTTQRRIAEARDKVSALAASDDVRRMVNRHLDRLDRRSRTDLSVASRQVEDFHATLDAGEIPIYE